MMWDEITYQYPNFYGGRLKFGNGKVISPNTLLACDYLTMLWFKLIHISKRAPGAPFTNMV